MVDVVVMLSCTKPGRRGGRQKGSRSCGLRRGRVNENGEPCRVITGQKRLSVCIAGGRASEWVCYIMLPNQFVFWVGHFVTSLDRCAYSGKEKPF